MGEKTPRDTFSQSLKEEACKTFEATGEVLTLIKKVLSGKIGREVSDSEVEEIKDGTTTLIRDRKNELFSKET